MQRGINQAKKENISFWRPILRFLGTRKKRTQHLDIKPKKHIINN